MTIDASKMCYADQMPFRGTSRISLYLDITAFCGEAQISNIHLVSIFARTHQEILRLNVAMDDVF